MSHTPGPWKTLAQPGRTVCAGKGKNFVLICDMEDAEDVATEYANARLIAAAPELLSACKAAAGQLDHLQFLMDTKKLGPLDALVQCRAAIAKALGK